MSQAKLRNLTDDEQAQLAQIGRKAVIDMMLDLSHSHKIHPLSGVTLMAHSVAQILSEIGGPNSEFFLVLVSRAYFSDRDGCRGHSNAVMASLQEEMLRHYELFTTQSEGRA